MKTSDCDWNKGLLPAIVQHAEDKRILMLGYMNQEALERTLADGKVTFFSRSKSRLWQKGESSGYSLVSIQVDCDQDAILIQAMPLGPTCHRGSASCFDAEWGLEDLDKLIENRLQKPSEDSYTSRLFQQGIARVAQKVGEEAVECVIAAMMNQSQNFLDEAADLVFHLLVLIRAKGYALRDITGVLAQRQKQNSAYAKEFSENNA